MPQVLAPLEMLELSKIQIVTTVMGKIDVSRGESRKMTKLPEKVYCLCSRQGSTSMLRNLRSAQCRTK